MTAQDKSYDLGITAACSVYLTGAEIDTSKTTLLGCPVIPSRYKSGIRFTLDEVQFWAGYDAEMEARKRGEQ